MKQRLYILTWILGLVFSSEITTAQYIDQVCAGATRVYLIKGATGSTFDWTVEGGTINQNWTDSIEVIWGDTPGVYSLNVTQRSIYGCFSAPLYGQVKVTSPKVDLGTENVVLCEGETVTLYAGNTFLNYKWNTGATSPAIQVDKEGWYKVEATDDIGCTASDSLFVRASQTPTVNLGPDTSLCWTETALLDAGNDGTRYMWFDNSNEKTYTAYAGLGYVWVKVFNADGCAGSDTILIKPCDYSKWADLIPNTFTPNNDNDNDTWWIPWMERVKNVKVEIFDRWGQSVYMSNNGLPATGWDGTRNGKKLPMDSYYYIIDFKNGSKPISGTITIIR